MTQHTEAIDPQTNETVSLRHRPTEGRWYTITAGQPHWHTRTIVACPACDSAATRDIDDDGAWSILCTGPDMHTFTGEA